MVEYNTVEARLALPEPLLPPEPLPDVPFADPVELLIVMIVVVVVVLEAEPLPLPPLPPEVSW